MFGIPRVAVFPPDGNRLEELKRLFQRREYSVRLVRDLSEIHDLVEDEDDPFDVIILPLSLEGDLSCVGISLQLKADESLASVPVLGLAFEAEKPAIEALYGAGVDIILTPPFDADLLFLQVGALTRQKRSFDELLSQHFERAGLRNSTLQAFNTVREGVLIFDRNAELIFANSAAHVLMGLPSGGETLSLWSEVLQQFRDLIKAHSSMTGKNNKDAISFFEAPLDRADRCTLIASIHVTSLTSQQGQMVGCAVALTDKSELQHLAAQLAQNERLRSLSLLLAAGSLCILDTNTLGSPGAPFRRIEELLDSGDPPAMLQSTAKAVLEIIDPLLDSGVNVRVRIPDDCPLAVKPTDLFQLLGHMLLHAAMNSGADGEISLDVEQNEGIATVVVRSLSKRHEPALGHDTLSQLSRGELAEYLAPADQEQKVTVGIQAAAKIAARCGTELQYRIPAPGERKFRVQLAIMKAGTTPQIP